MNNEKPISFLVSDSSPGTLLRESRVHLGWSEVEVAEALKITRDRLRALENNDFSCFSARTYIIGHLKNYSRLLRVNEVSVLEAYDRFFSAEENVSFDSLAGQELSRLRPDWMQMNPWWFFYLLCVLSATALIVYNTLIKVPDNSIQPDVLDARLAQTSKIDDSFDDRLIKLPSNSTNSSINLIDSSSNVIDSHSSKRSALTSTNTLTNHTVSDDQLSSSSDRLKVSSLNVPDLPLRDVEKDFLVSRLTASELMNLYAQREADTEPDEEAIAQLVTTGDQLSFRFENPCWVKVTDANDQVIFVGLQQAGTDLSLYGKAPFGIVVGNVEGTSLMYNGDPIRLTSNRGKKSLRLSIGG